MASKSSDDNNNPKVRWWIGRFVVDQDLDYPSWTKLLLPFCKGISKTQPEKSILPIAKTVQGCFFQPDPRVEKFEVLFRFYLSKPQRLSYFKNPGLYIYQSLPTQICHFEPSTSTQSETAIRMEARRYGVGLWSSSNSASPEENELNNTKTTLNYETLTDVLETVVEPSQKLVKRTDVALPPLQKPINLLKSPQELQNSKTLKHFPSERTKAGKSQHTKKMSLKPENLAPNSKRFWQQIWQNAACGNLDAIPPQIRVALYNPLKQIYKDHDTTNKSVSHTRGVWIYGPPGVGKSTWARNYFSTEPSILKFVSKLKKKNDIIAVDQVNQQIAKNLASQAISNLSDSQSEKLNTQGNISWNSEILEEEVEDLSIDGALQLEMQFNEKAANDEELRTLNAKIHSDDWEKTLIDIDNNLDDQEGKCELNLIPSDRIGMSQVEKKDSQINTDDGSDLMMILPQISSGVPKTKGPEESDREIVLDEEIDIANEGEVVLRKDPNSALIYSKSADTKWFDNYKGEPVVLIEDIDHVHKRALGHHLKIWADSFGIKAEVKGSITCLCHQLLVVTSNYHIQDLWPPGDPLCQALKRRFKVINFPEFAERISGQNSHHEAQILINPRKAADATDRMLNSLGVDPLSCNLSSYFAHASHAPKYFCHPMNESSSKNSCEMTRRSEKKEIGTTTETTVINKSMKKTSKNSTKVSTTVMNDHFISSQPLAAEFRPTWSSILNAEQKIYHKKPQNGNTSQFTWVLNDADQRAADFVQKYVLKHKQQQQPARDRFQKESLSLQPDFMIEEANSCPGGLESLEERQQQQQQQQHQTEKLYNPLHKVQIIDSRFYQRSKEPNFCKPKPSIVGSAHSKPSQVSSKLKCEEGEEGEGAGEHIGEANPYNFHDHESTRQNFQSQTLDKRKKRPFAANEDIYSVDFEVLFKRKVIQIEREYVVIPISELPYRIRASLMTKMMNNFSWRSKFLKTAIFSLNCPEYNGWFEFSIYAPTSPDTTVMWVMTWLYHVEEKTFILPPRCRADSFNPTPDLDPEIWPDLALFGQQLVHWVLSR